MHPGIEIITRDQAYAAAARSTLPEATQMADRFHLVQNAIQALKTFFKSHSWKFLPAPGYQLKEQFQKIIRDRDAPGLGVWLQEALISGIKPFQGMVSSIRQDFAAVQNALLFSFSNAQCVGKNCRLKLIKRVGYGRAKPDLLRQRVLHHLKPISQLRC